MVGKRILWMTAIVLLLGLMMPSSASAGPFFGEWSCWWMPARDCPCGEYSPCHWWTPEFYVARSCICPSNLNQYPPGPMPPVGLTVERTPYRCASTPPVVAPAYGDPAAYYGLPVMPKR